MRKLSQLCMNTTLSRKKVKQEDGTVKHEITRDCGTDSGVYFHVADEKSLNRVVGRYYKKNSSWMLICSSDTHLIGKRIYMRSPITCGCKDGKICATCYGSLAKINSEIHVGILGIEILTSQLTQQLLSAKHLLKTNSEEINWPEAFSQFFMADGNQILVSSALDFDKKYMLVLEEDAIQDNDEVDEEDEMDYTKFVRKFSIRAKGQPDIEIDSPKDLFLSPYLKKILETKVIKNDEGEYRVNLKDLEAEEPLFFIEIENNELSKHLHNILNLIDNKAHLGVETKEEMLDSFNNLLTESKIHIQLVHVENIIREMLRNPDDIIHRPDFASNPDAPYEILRVSEAIMKSPSVINSLGFEKIKRQLYEPLTYRKNEPSFFDRLF